MELEKNSKTLVLDGDTPLYRASLALQESYIEVWWEDRMIECKNLTEFKGGKLNGKIIKGKLQEINDNKKTNFILDDFKIIPKTRLIQSNNDKMRLGLGKKFIREYISNLYQIHWVKEVVYCLSSENNFRRDIDKEYKSNRTCKPVLLDTLRNWFIKEFKDIIKIEDGLEADDLLSIFGHKSRNSFTNPKDTDIVLCGYDKDLLQIYNNYFFNFDHREDGVFWIDEFEGQKSLAKQCIIGDRIDNIKGLPKINEEIKAEYNVRLGGVGSGKAEKILSDCKTVGDLFKTVENCYKMYYKDNYKEKLNKQFKLVKLLENKEEIKDFPFKE